MALKRRLKKDGSTFSTKGKKANAAFEEIDVEEVAKEAHRGIGFDAHFVTNKSIEFGKILTGMPLYDYQEVTAYCIIHSLLTGSNETLTMLFSRQSGKTETLAFVINTVSVLFPALAKIMPALDHFKDGVHIGLFAPQSDQVWNTYNRALLRLTNENAELVMGDPELEVSLTRPNRYELTNGSALTAQVASKQSKIEGATYHMVIIEEAQDCDDYVVQKSIAPMLTATGGLMVKCGTTGTSKDHFWNDININRNIDRRQKDHRLNLHWEFDYIRIIRDKRKQFEKDGKPFHLKYEQSVQKEIRRHGRDSQTFKLNYALIWDLESGMLITDKDFDKLCNNKKGHRIDKSDIIVAGMDIGKDIASTVVTLMKVIYEPNDEGLPPRKEICGWLELSNVDYDMQHHLVVDYLFENGVVNMVADYTGVGKPVIDRLIAAVGESINIVPYPFSKQSKSDMWFSLIDEFQTERIIIPANRQVRGTKEWEHFEEQIKNCLKYYDGAELVCHKADGFLDDYPDSLGLANLASVFEVADEVEEELFNPLLGNLTHNRILRQHSGYQ